MRFRNALIAAAIAVSGAGCSAAATSGAGGPGAPDRSAPVVSTQPPAKGSAPSAVAGNSLVATADPAGVLVRHAPGGPVWQRIAGRTRHGAPTAFLVVRQRPGWVQVQLPSRPNGSTGWIAERQVRLSADPYRLVVHRGRHRLEVWAAGKLVADYPVGVGASVTPTPAGTYYLTELLVPPERNGGYGPFAFGLSAFSDTLTSFAGGPGQLGLHGTDVPGSVGKDVSHGCLRVTNAVITELAHQLPLGTPIEITS